MDEPPPPDASSPPRRRRRRRLLFVLLALGLGPLLALGLGEGYVRWRYPAYGDLWGAIRSHPVWVRELRPGVSGRMRALTGEYDHHYAINAQGLREAAPLGAKDPARPRVVVVGDSNTFGLGVEDDQVWLRALTQAGVEPVNAGWASGYSPDTACLFLEARVDELQPDLVIQQLTPDNDLLDLAQRSVWHEDAQGRLVRITHRYDAVPDWIQAMALPRFLVLQVLPTLRARASGGAPSAAPALSSLEEEGLRRLRVMLERERAFLSARGIDFAVLVFPDPEPFLDHDASPRAAKADLRRARVLALVRELGLNTCDPQPELPLDGPSLFYREGHMTPAGNAAVARLAVPWVRAWVQGRR